jgi:8-oxo-dGTP diphosphatase
MTPYTYDYPRPMVTVDCIVTSGSGNGLQILLIRRGNEPFKDLWALPGGFVDMDEDLHEAARRELMEETGIECENLVQFKAYGAPGRDPRGRTISVVFTGTVGMNTIALPGDDAADAGWFPVSSLPDLAFDHSSIVNDFLHAGK